jgi:hypothetical protein
VNRLSKIASGSISATPAPPRPIHWLHQINAAFFLNPGQDYTDAGADSMAFRVIRRASEILEEPPPDLSSRAMDALRLLEDLISPARRSFSRLVEVHGESPASRTGLSVWLVAMAELHGLTEPITNQPLR